MPEAPEIRIMSDFINNISENHRYTSIVPVEKGNLPDYDNQIIIEDDSFDLESDFYGKQLKLKLKYPKKLKEISVFMGMSGNWKLVDTNNWNETKFTRLKMDRDDGKSLILYGGYMGPKYKIGGFDTKRGYDIINDFDKFKSHILENINDKFFLNPICDVLLDQRYFNGVGNYLRSTILYYMDVNPFESAVKTIQNNSQIFDFCRNVIVDSYNMNGGQLKDWTNPMGGDSSKFHDWVFYKKGLSCIDKMGRTFWFNPKWVEKCPYKIKNIHIKLKISNE